VVDPFGEILETSEDNNNFTDEVNITQHTTLEIGRSDLILLNEMIYFIANWTRDDDGDGIPSMLTKNWILTRFSVNAVEADDINNDGFTEIVFDQPYRDLFVYNSTGSLLHNLSDTILEDTPYDLEIADLSNDGKKEIVYGDIGRNLIILNSTLGVLDNLSMGEYVWPEDNWVTTVEVGDVNNDSYNEIVVGTEKGTVDNLRVYTAYDLTLMLLWSYNLSDSIYFHALDLADVNNDGVLDIRLVAK